jgi:alkylation response protein AidB-like acyl-CoA dehydrogenase
MNNPQLDNTATDDVAMERLACEISELARSHAAETERQRQLDGELLSSLRTSGLMMAGAPREVGGLELAPGLALHCAEEIARGDASAGWCVSIAATSSLLAAYLPEEGRDELFADPRGIAAGIFAPHGRARAVEGGVIVDGRWAYCSGIMHSGVLFAGCFIGRDGTSSDEPPRPSSVGMLREELEVIDTWRTLGLRGTGSHDAVADDLFIPTARVLCLLDGPLIDRPLYRFPAFGYFALSIAAAALGNARGAIDEFAALAAHKVGQGSTRALAERSATHAVAAEAEASLRAARGLFYEAIDAAWTAAHDNEPVSVPLRNDLRLAATHATRTSAEAVRVLYDLAGGPAIYDDSPLQRRFRDAYTATAHFQVNAASRELQGRILLGQPAHTLMI